MINDTLTFLLEGDITFKDFAAGVQRFYALIQALSSEVAGPGAVEWLVDDLAKGSALGQMRGVSRRTNDPENVNRVALAYGAVGLSLMEGRPISYSRRVANCAQRVERLIGTSIKGVRFHTAQVDAVVKQAAKDEQPVHIVHSLGAIKGRVETLTARRGYRFTLYDALFDKPILCFPNEDQGEEMRDLWGKKVLVSGRLARSSDDRRVIAIRDITRIDVLDDPLLHSYTEARGALAGLAVDAPAEVIIRRLRDAQ